MCTFFSYSIAQSVQDLEIVLSKLIPKGNPSFHLLGHSYGGVLAFESQRGNTKSRQSSPVCKSLVLSNAPTNMKVASDEYDRLYKQNPLTFWNEHSCRVGTPPALQNAIEHSGTVWGGMQVVLDYVAQPPMMQDTLPPTLIISGSFDFGLKSGEGWKDIVPDATLANFETCAHYPFYEDGPAFGQALEDFFLATER
jgi:pimeloyl-ACP methyl ester carboxylesterase